MPKSSKGSVQSNAKGHRVRISIANVVCYGLVRTTKAAPDADLAKVGLHDLATWECVAGYAERSWKRQQKPPIRGGR